MNTVRGPSVRHTPKYKRTIPKGRSNRTLLLIWVVALLCFLGAAIISVSTTGFMDSLWIILSIAPIIVFLAEVSLRTIHIYEERIHLYTRYENSIKNLLTDIYYFPNHIIIGTIIAIAVFVIYQKNTIENPLNPLQLWYNMGLWSLILSFFGFFFLHQGLNLRSGPLYDSLAIEYSNGLDYGSAMAQSFFFGYLKLVIPKTGTTEKHLVELMQDYEDEHQVKINLYKLFILIPKSMYCQTSLKNENNPSIEESSSLKEKVITVAGVRNRVYKNSVYKIKSGDRTFYVCAEYATPLKTFKEGLGNDGYARTYKKMKNDIVFKFYKTLKKVLKEHEDCTSFCELIYFDDKDVNGHYVDVGAILLNRIYLLMQRARPNNP